MIHWADEPTPLYTDFLHSAIGFTLNQIQFDNVVSDNSYEEFMENAFGCVDADDVGVDVMKAMFPKPLLVQILKDLESALDSDVKLLPTQYHFLVLDRVILDFVSCIGFLVHAEKESGDADFTDEIIDFLVPKLLTLKKQLTYEFIKEVYFFDCDYDLNPEIYKNLTPQEIAKLGLDDELFGVVNRMTPHPDELKMKVISE